MIERLTLKNYRAFEKADIELSRINLVFGPNNSGKSALISAINLLAQTVENVNTEVPILLDGTRVDLGTYKDAVFRNEAKRPIELGLTVSGARKEEVQTRTSFKVGFNYRVRRKNIVVSDYEFSFSDGTVDLKAKTNGKYPNCSIEGHFTNSKGVKKPVQLRAMYRNFFPFPKLRMKDTVSVTKGESLITSAEFSWALYCHYNVIDALEMVEYIGPFREHPKRTFHFTGAIPSSVGTRGEYAINILADDFLKRGKKKKHISDRVAEWLKKSGIANQVTVYPISDRHFEVKLKHSSTGEDENLADVGYGCGQVLPILVSGLSAEKGTLLMVEQPEIHLHPRAQAELGSFFFDLYKNNVQTIIETHSEHLLLRLQYYVAKGWIKPSDIKVYYVHASRRTKTRGKTIKEIRLDDTGRFIDKWPEGFFPETLEEARKVAKARAGRR